MLHTLTVEIKDEIAQQFYNDKINGQHKVDVILGGGSKYFGKNNGNLTKNSKMMAMIMSQIKQT